MKIPSNTPVVPREEIETLDRIHAANSPVSKNFLLVISQALQNEGNRLISAGGEDLYDGRALKALAWRYRFQAGIPQTPFVPLPEA